MVVWCNFFGGVAYTKIEKIYLENYTLPQLMGLVGVRVCINSQNYHVSLVDEWDIVVYLGVLGSRQYRCYRSL